MVKGWGRCMESSTLNGDRCSHNKKVKNGPLVLRKHNNGAEQTHEVLQTHLSNVFSHVYAL